MSGMAYEQSMETVCEECGSDNVTAQMEGAWNPKWNQWEPTGEIDYYYCNGKCSGETKVVQRPKED